jgi:putative sterol carrier protein
VPVPVEDDALLNVGSYAITLKTFSGGEVAGVNETYELHIDQEVLQVQIHAGELQVRRGAIHADVVIHTDMPTYLALLTGQIKPAAAISEGLVRVEGDRTEDGLNALSRFLDLCEMSIRPLNPLE